ncbi:MAG: HAD domain-containing protein [Thomasclavelia sp.]|nr:HAD domain-containing protein [Thomasclavelia sp.]
MKTIYLFLDVDGVLNNQKIIQETKKMQVIDEQNLINLNKLIKTIKKEDNCSIILNSSWQLVNENIDILKSYLNKYDLRIDDYLKIDNQKNKGELIIEYCNKHQISSLDILVIDDGMISEIKDRLIKCNFNYGFTEVELQKAIKLLKM